MTKVRAVPYPLSVLVVATLASGCTHAAALTAPDMAPLSMPTPPPRDVEPVDVEAPQPVPLPEEPARRAPTTRPRPQAPRVEAPKTEAKPEPPKPDAPPPPPEPPKPVEEPPKPSTLQTTPAASEGEVERAIRATLAHANSDLKRVDYRTLNADARTQYDYAIRFMQQAEDALGKKNLVFARTVADKAAALAAQLSGK